jgi:DeoR/GlpR family transcriptional regulator of sugar metabolism
MRTQKLLPVNRREEVLRVVTTQGSASVPELAFQFGVSPDTIRRDLDALAGWGDVVRTHGGALRPKDMVAITPVSVRIASEADAKTRIGMAAAELIEKGETLVVNGGSTTLAFVKALRRELFGALITNSISILDQVDPSKFSNIYAIGGELVSASKVTLGPIHFLDTARINVQTAVIGVRAVSSARGISTASVAEASMISQMIGIAARTIVVVDATKFEKAAFASIAPLQDLDILVTNAPPPAPLTAALKTAGVQLVVAR